MTQITQKIENNSQTNVISHFKSLPNKGQENEEENKVFELVLVDINKSDYSGIKCAKKDMYDSELKYICISYRWGELNGQQVETPDYTAHITSFKLYNLILLCKFIKEEPDLKNIPYLWIDTISIDQQNHARKNDIILKMNQIYQYATSILAVPDLHFGHIWEHPANKEIMKLISNKYLRTIYDEVSMNEELNNDSIYDYDFDDGDNESPIFINPISEQHTNKNNDSYSFMQKLKNMNMINEDVLKKIEELYEIELNIKSNEIKMKYKNKKIKEEKKRIYQHLAYLIEDWSNRAWVIGEYQIAKDKYMKYGTPLKYWFISLIDYELHGYPFFSYHFDNDDDQQNTINYKVLTVVKVNDCILFNQFVKSRFMQRSHLEIILNSKATKNEDRFNAILPLWNKYNHLIKNKNTISDWNITDMTSVRLKLYEIMDLWDKALLLLECREGKISPSFVSNNYISGLKIIEKVDYNNVAYKEFEASLLEYISKIPKRKKVAIKIKKLMDSYKMNSKSIWNENLISIQFESHYCYLSVKSNSYFTRIADPYDKDNYQNELLFDDDDEIHIVLIPFFTSNLPDYIDKPYIYNKYGSNILLIGNMNKNKWILKYDQNLDSFKSEDYGSTDYIFNVY